MTRSGDELGPRRDPAIRHDLSELWVSLLCGFAGMVLLIAGARWGLPSAIVGPIGDGGWTARTRGWFVADGFLPPEVDLNTLHQFSWTGAGIRLVIAHLDRSQVQRLTVRFYGGRPPGVSLPQFRVLVDGAVRATVQTSNEPQRLSIDLPVRTAGRTVVTLVASETFVPSPSDPRALGVVIDEIGIAPVSGHFWPAGLVTAEAGFAIFACVAGVLLTGLCGWPGRTASGAVTMAFVWLLLRDGAFMGGYVDRLVHLGIGVALFGAFVGLIRARWAIIAGLPEWSSAIGLLLAVSTVKLALFAHPLATVGDAIFQVHRAQQVYGGNYFFTSITPRPFFEFPYAIALYVAALPLWSYFPSTMDLVRLLRGLALGADALVGLALYAALRRQWDDRFAALLAAALWPFARSPMDALVNANLTNVFGQGFFGVAMGIIAWAAVAPGGSAVAMVLAAAMLLIAFLSHFSTISVGVPIACAAGTFLVLGGRAHVRRVGVWVLVMTLAVAAVSYAVYYSHFNAIYQQTFQRLVSHEGEAATRSIVAPASTKLDLLVTGKSNDYGLPGVPMMIAAVFGAALLARSRLREGVTLVLWAWALMWLGFEALGVFSAVEMRANLAAAPMFVGFGAYALGAIRTRSRFGTPVAIVAAFIIIADGLRSWLSGIGY